MTFVSKHWQHASKIAFPSWTLLNNNSCRDLFILNDKKVTKVRQKTDSRLTIQIAYENSRKNPQFKTPQGSIKIYHPLKICRFSKKLANGISKNYTITYFFPRHKRVIFQTHQSADLASLNTVKMTEGENFWTCLIKIIFYALFKIIYFL